MSLEYDNVMDLADAVYFDATIRIGNPLRMEVQWLEVAGDVYCRVFVLRGLEHRRDPALKRAIDKYGRKAVAKRILALLLQDNYLKGKPAIYHPNIARTFCEFKEIVISIVSLQGHVSVLRRGWETMKQRGGTMDSETRYNFSPRYCINLLSV